MPPLMRSRLWIACALLCAGSLAGCNNEMQDENTMLKGQKAEMQQELDRTKTALDSSENSRRQLEEENSRLKMASANPADPVAGSDSGDMHATPTKSKLSNLPPDVHARVEGNSVVIDIPGDVMFD